ncbi:MAG: N-acyl amino acid synthase FeeM domain-containing protein [bacterium]
MEYRKINSNIKAAYCTAVLGTLYSYNNFSKYANIFVRKADSRDDIQGVFDVRWKGYAKYFTSKEEMVDEYDLASNVTLLLAHDDQRNPLGTLRILDRRFGDIELDAFLDVDSLLPEDEQFCIEATRFSIPPHPHAGLIKLFLWKALLLYCLGNKIHTILISIRPRTARVYRRLLFDSFGPSGIYNHPLLKNLEHHCYHHTIAEKRAVMKDLYPDLYQFLYQEYHPTIHHNCYMPAIPKSTVYAYNSDKLIC